MKLTGGAPRDGDPEHRVPGSLPRLACRRERVRLPCARFAGDDGHTVTVETEPANEPLLLRRQRRACGYCPSYRRRVHHAHALASGRLNLLDQRMLECEMLGRRVANELTAGRNRPSVATPEPLGRPQATVARDQRNGMRGAQELVGGRFERQRVGADAGLAQRLDSAAT